MGSMRPGRRRVLRRRRDAGTRRSVAAEARSRLRDSTSPRGRAVAVSTGAVHGAPTVALLLEPLALEPESQDPWELLAVDAERFLDGLRAHGAHLQRGHDEAQHRFYIRARTARESAVGDRCRLPGRFGRMTGSGRSRDRARTPTGRLGVAGQVLERRGADCRKHLVGEFGGKIVEAGGEGRHQCETSVSRASSGYHRCGNGEADAHAAEQDP